MSQIFIYQIIRQGNDKSLFKPYINFCDNANFNNVLKMTPKFNAKVQAYAKIKLPKVIDSNFINKIQTLYNNIAKKLSCQKTDGIEYFLYSFIPKEPISYGMYDFGSFDKPYITNDYPTWTTNTSGVLTVNLNNFAYMTAPYINYGTNR